MDDYDLLLPKEIILMIFDFNNDEFLIYSRLSKWCRECVIKYILPTNENLQLKIIKILSKNNRFGELNQFLHQGSRGQFKKFYSTIIKWFVKCGKIELFQILLKLPENIFNIIDNGDTLFKQSMWANQDNLVKLLLTDKRIVPPVEAIEGYLMCTILDNHIDYVLSLATILIDYCDINICHDLYANSRRKDAHKFNEMMILKNKLNLKLIYKDCEFFMGNKEIVTKFLNDSSIDHFSWKYVLSNLARKNYVDLFTMLVTKLEGKFTEDYRLSLFDACKAGSIDIVKILLLDKRFTSKMINYAIRRTIHCNSRNPHKLEVLYMLSNDARSDPKYSYYKEMQPFDVMDKKI